MISNSHTALVMSKTDVRHVITFEDYLKQVNNIGNQRRLTTNLAKMVFRRIMNNYS